MYKVCKQFSGKTISGNILLPINTELTLLNNLLYYNDKPICYITSQNCYDYMANNADGKAIERFNLIQQIKTTYNAIIKADDDRYHELIKDLPEDADLPAYVSSLPFNINFNFNFYNKTINELNDILGGLTNE